MLRRRLACSLLAVLALGALCLPGSAAADGDGPVVILETPGDGVGFYQGQQVQAGYGCQPGPLGWPVIACDGDVPLGSYIDTSSAGEHTFTVRAVDYAGAETVVTHRYAVFDVIPPVITITSPTADAAYPYGAQVFVHYSCADPNGSGVVGCIGSLRDGAPLPTDQPGVFSFQVDAFDQAGNHAVASVKYRVVDLTPPAITITTPAEGVQYLLNQAVTPEYSCHDDVDGSNVVCLATALDTATVGAHTFRVDTRDSSGNTASASRNYSVVYNFSGFFSPLAPAPTVSTFKAGDDLPVKFSLAGNQGLDIFGAPPAWKPGCPSASLDWTAANGSLSYNAKADRYVFLAKTDRSWAGSCWQLVLTLRDGTVHRANVSFR
jgi:hypothetical protein